MNARSKLYFSLAGAACLLVVVIFATRAQPAALTSDLALRQGQVLQEGRDLEFTVETAKPVDLADLKAQPDTAAGGERYLCLELIGEGEDPGARICPTAGNMVGITPLAGGGKADESREVHAEVTQPRSGTTTVRIPFGQLEMDGAPYDFRFVSSDGSCSGSAGSGCVDAIPDRGRSRFNLRVPALVGCEGAQGQEYRNGSRDEPKVALTFDDGPGASTEEILDILNEKKADATFFLLGSMVERGRDLVERIPRQGSEVANHSTNHQARPDQADLENTNGIIEDASGVKPCSFRPPYGDVNATVVADGKRAGLDTILWDVDTNDWQSSATVDGILDNVAANTQNGSIILMHDGGDNRRPITIEALPKVIDLLREKGFTLVTVSELTGNDITWEPLGDPVP